MTCSRCQGFLVQERKFDVLDVSIHHDVWGCTNCGDISDQVILTNRQAKGVNPATPMIHQAP